MNLEKKRSCCATKKWWWWLCMLMYRGDTSWQCVELDCKQNRTSATAMLYPAVFTQPWRGWSSAKRGHTRLTPLRQCDSRVNMYLQLTPSLQCYSMMSSPGIEPGSSQPQCEILTTVRIRPTVYVGMAFMIFMLYGPSFSLFQAHHHQRNITSITIIVSGINASIQ